MTIEDIITLRILALSFIPDVKIECSGDLITYPGVWSIL
jgi:hypothetical protein